MAKLSLHASHGEARAPFHWLVFGVCIFSGACSENTSLTVCPSQRRRVASRGFLLSQVSGRDDPSGMPRENRMNRRVAALGLGWDYLEKPWHFWQVDSVLT